MPQMTIEKIHTPCGFTVDYAWNPLAPDRDARLTVSLLNVRGEPVDFATATIPSNVVHEAVVDLVRASWEAYLFGEMGDLRPAFRRVLLSWCDESVRRADIH